MKERNGDDLGFFQSGLCKNPTNHNFVIWASNQASHSRLLSSNFQVSCLACCEAKRHLTEVKIGKSERTHSKPAPAVLP
jgi:hypothetical protein